MDTLLAAMQNWFDPDTLGPLLLGWGGRILAAAAILLIGRSIAGLLVAWLHRGANRASMDATLARFLGRARFLLSLRSRMTAC